ncbi:hypothetical protein Tco_1148832, partial [Tanacetum coccineum]
HEKPILERLPFYFTPPTAIDAVIPDPTLDKLTGTEPNAKVLAKAEASTKRRSSTSARTSSQSTKCRKSTITNDASGSSRRQLFDESSAEEDDDDDEDIDDDDCTKILHVTTIRSAAQFLSRGN